MFISSNKYIIEILVPHKRYCQRFYLLWDWFCEEKWWNPFMMLL